MAFDPVDLALIRKLGGAALPFGEVTTVKEVLAECQLEPVDSQGGRTIFLVDAIDIVDGETYIIKYNGAEYRCVATSGTAENTGISGIQLGNSSIINKGDDTGEPFVVALVGDNCGIYTIDGSTTLTISIRQEVTEVKKISGKYVEGMGYVEESRKLIAEVSGETVEENNFNGTVTTNTISYINANPNELSDEIEYLIDFDGQEYRLTRLLFNYGGTVIGFGNPALHFPAGSNGVKDTGEPFFWFFFGGSSHLVTETPGSHTLKVYEPSETIHPVDGKYVNTVFYADSVYSGGYIYKDSGLTEKVTKAELLNTNMAFVISDYDGNVASPVLMNANQHSEFGSVLTLNYDGTTLSAVTFTTAEYEE